MERVNHARRPGALTARELPLDDVLRDRVEPALRGYGDLYAIYKDGTLVGVTDEYGTAQHVEPGFHAEDLEDLLLTSDGDWRDVAIGIAQ